LVYDITNKKSFENLNKWKEGFIENAGPDDPKTFPFVLLGNKVDREPERKVDSKQAQQWARENGDILNYETSAKEGVSVNDAFIEMAKMALKREANNQIIMPDSIGGASGAIKL
jgi:Ras-related protein Rab-7A